MNTLRRLMMGIMVLVAVIAVPVTALAELSSTDPNLVGLWHMDGDWKDASSQGNDLTPTYGPTFSSDAKIGTMSGRFYGSTSYLRRASGNSLPLGSSPRTLVAWIKPYSYLHDLNGIISYGQMVNGNKGATLAVKNDGRLAMAFWWNDASQTQGTTVTVGQWNLVAITYDGGTTVKFYVNGEFVQERPLSAGVPANTQDGPVRIGSVADPGRVFDGLIDDAAIYSRALSATEIQELYRDYLVNLPTVNPVTSPTTAPNIALSGTKPANTAITVNGNILVPLDGQTTWQTNYTLAQGTNSLAITARDSQNYDSRPVTLTVVLDSTPPQVTATTPANNEILKTSPGAVTFTLADALSPLDLASTIKGATLANAAGLNVSGVWSSSGSGTVGTVTFTPAVALSEGIYTATIKPTDALANASVYPLTFTIDSTPPVVGATPSGGIFGSAQSISLSVNEPAVVYYTTDGSTPTVNATRYSQPITIPASAILKYFGRDLAGNDSGIKTENYVIDATPPVLALSTLSDGAYTNNETLNIAGTVTDDTDVKGITVNGVAVPLNPDGSFSYALLLQNGANIITLTAADSAGNLATDTRTVTLDQTAPVLTVTAPADNSKTGNMLLNVSGTVDKTSTVTVKLNDTVQSALMDGGTFSATIILEPGYNTIEITATDLAGNRSTLKRTVLYDDQKPSLAIIAPNQDLRTNQSSMTIKGTVSDPMTTVGVTISKDNEVFTPPVVNGTFEQVVNFAEEKTYDIAVAARNEVGSETSVQRNVIYDVTPPVLGIDPVPSPTNRQSLSVTGTKEAGTAVTVTCATATVGEVSYPTATTWRVDISGLSEGKNVIAAASVDAAGNEVTTTATVVLVTRLPEITLKATPDVIWTPDHQLVPVTIAGGVDAFGADIKSVSISVRDEYGTCEYKDLTFGSTVMLEAWRNGNDTDGRKYTITAVVTDTEGATTTKTTTVTVLHDNGKRKK